jgi:hypothetical protein
MDKCPHCGKPLKATAEPDRRVFMYRLGEARMFDSPESIPAGEGWQDTPQQSPQIEPQESTEDAPAVGVAEEIPATGDSPKPRRRKKAE